jgi:hypothetical protein
MKPDQIEEQIEANRRLINLKENEISILRQNNKKLKIDKQTAIFEMVLEFIDIGESIEFTKGYSKGGLSNGDIVEIIKKNDKSVVVKYVKMGSWRSNKLGSTKRIISSVFGEWVYNNTDHIKKMIERNSALKELLG